jgi:hypothetical protein
MNRNDPQHGTVALPVLRRTILPLLFLLAALPLAAADDSLAGPMRRVENLRGLKFDHAVSHRAIERSELKDRIREQMAKTMPYSTDDFALVLQALQLVDSAKSSDLIGSMLKLYESQVLAFYDPLSHTYYSLRDITSQKDLSEAGMMADAVEIHELTHALQDQRFGAGVRDLALMKDTDAGMAYHSLLEGEASVVMLSYVLAKSGVTLDTIAKNEALVGQMTSATAAADKSIDPATPKYFSESLMFPYAAGMKLVLEAYRRGGWPLVNRMDENPPRSTREVIHYNEYFARLDRGTKGDSTFDAQPVAGVRNPLTVEHLGEFHWRFLVGDRSSFGWVDDRVTIAQDERCQPTVLVETRWQDEKRARNFREAYVAFLKKRGLDPLVAAGDGTTVRVAYGVDDALMEQFTR